MQAPITLCLYSLDVLLEFHEEKGVLVGSLCGKETFFTVPTIERMARHFMVSAFPTALKHVSLQIALLSCLARKELER